MGLGLIFTFIVASVIMLRKEMKNTQPDVSQL